MGFKLVRVDSAEPLKLNLPVGKHLIGRGNFLNDNISDRRVSKKHAELEVTSDEITIKSLHQNPCFYIKKYYKETLILKQNESIKLANGDKFGVLPQTYWYEVIYCILNDSPDITTNMLQNNVDNNSETTDIDNRTENADVTDCDLSEEVERSASPSVISASDQAPETNESHVTDGNADEEIKRSASPSIMSTSDQPQETSNSQSLLEPQSSESSGIKRLHSEDYNEDASKRLKTEPQDIKQETVDAVVKDEPVDNAEPGPSNDQGTNQGVASNNNGPNDAKQNVPAKAPRERCIYGANCYRRNPQHKAQFSHPSDSDWGTGDRGVCPYGKACLKRDPRHWLHHEHPPGVQPPPNAPQPGKKKNKAVKRKSYSSESEDDIDLNIVTGKRARKPLIKDTWKDSGSENEDPYATDESDEWQPSTTDFTETQDY